MLKDVVKLRALTKEFEKDSIVFNGSSLICHACGIEVASQRFQISKIIVAY